MKCFSSSVLLIPCLLAVSAAHTQAAQVPAANAAPAPAANANKTPSVAVRTETPRAGAVPDVITAYGSAAPAPDGGMTLSLPREGRGQAVAVTPGAIVTAGDRLLDFVASPAAVAAWQQAGNALAAARAQRGHIAQLLTQQLATRDQLAQAAKAAADAQTALDALQREGADQPTQTLTAPFDGMVVTVPVVPGDRVQPGAALATLTRRDGLVVTVGIEPGSRGQVHPGQAVHLLPLDDGAPLDGHVLRVAGVLNPKTRLIDADVSVASGAVISGAAFRADITVGQLQGWVVPHDAVLTDGRGAYVFQVAAGMASRVDIVIAGAAGDNDVVNGNLDSRNPLVVQGNYQLTDHALVRMVDAP